MIVSAACVFLGLILAFLAFAVIAVMVTFGLVSASILVGTWRKSFRKGYLFFLLAAGSIAGCVCGMVLMSLLAEVFDLTLGDRQTLLWGSAGGALGGLLTGYLVYRLTGFTIGFFRKKLRIA